MVNYTVINYLMSLNFSKKIFFFYTEPERWSVENVAAWMQWAGRQLQLPSLPADSFNVDGVTLASFTEEDFCQRAPQVNKLKFCNQ